MPGDRNLARHAATLPAADVVDGRVSVAVRGSHVERALADRGSHSRSGMLAARPEVLRRLDHLLRLARRPRFA